MLGTSFIRNVPSVSKRGLLKGKSLLIPCDCFEVAIEATEQAADVILGYLGSAYRIDRKAQRDILADVDLLAQEAIVNVIKARFSDHDIWAEEGSERNDSPCTWIIDPLDGTINYVNRLPCFCTSIALQHSGEIILALVNDPLNNRLFTFQGVRHVSKTKKLADAMIALDWPGGDAAREKTLELATTITRNARTLRSFGSAALSLCYVAEGWLDGFIHANLEPWDAAAGALIVRNAGGRVTDFAGQPWRPGFGPLVASNGLLHDQILNAIN
jgi:myo-inositol-1(or 4)-monophosphatase